jgi:hypothetical protein
MVVVSTVVVASELMRVGMGLLDEEDDKRISLR